jgi:hypothetical protein
MTVARNAANGLCFMIRAGRNRRVGEMLRVIQLAGFERCELSGDVVEYQVQMSGTDVVSASPRRRRRASARDSR